MLRRGAASLSDAELLAVLLRPGPHGQALDGGIESARALLEAHGGLGGLLELKAQRCRHPGIGPARSAALVAAVELSRRLARARVPCEKILDAPGDVAAYLAVRYGTPDHEVFGALYLDLRHRLIADAELYRGALDRATVEPRAVLREALALSAKSFVIFHTHPSGSLEPSRDDIAFTRRMAQAGEVVGIRLQDHLIVTNDGRWVALSRSHKW